MKAKRQIVLSMDISDAKLLSAALKEEINRTQELLSQNEGKVMLEGSYLHTTDTAITAVHKMSLMVKELETYI
jgi:hypothetical protein